MRKALLVVLWLTGAAVFARANTNQIAPGAVENLQSLLNRPSAVRPAAVTAMERGWFRMEIEIHVFTDEVSLGQVAAVMLDLENISKYYQGKKSRLNATIVQRDGYNAIIDYVSVTPVLGFQVRTPYRASVQTLENTETAIFAEIRQIDSATNNSIRNIFTTRFARAIAIDGKTYTYVRTFVSNEVNTGLAPVSRAVLERNSFDANVEWLELLIAAAKTK